MSKDDRDKSRLGSEMPELLFHELMFYRELADGRSMWRFEGDPDQAITIFIDEKRNSAFVAREEKYAFIIEAFGSSN